MPQRSRDSQVPLIVSDRQAREVKKHIKLQHQTHLRNHLTSLPAQGRAACCADLDTTTWSTSTKELPDEQFKFIMNAIVDTLPRKLTFIGGRDVKSIIVLFVNKHSL